MSQNSSKKKLLKSNYVLPLLNYKQITSLVILLLVTSSSTQTPSSSYVCPTDCECKVDDFSARCENLDSLIASYSRKHASRLLMPIKSLDLSNNELTKISNQLEVLVNLTELNLSHNQLTQVHKLNFQHLENLDLSFNHITSAKLSKLPRNIVSLNLAHNEITYLPVDFMKLKKLRTLDLHENPLNCTCETLHVRNWMSYQNVWSSKVIKCTSPQIVKGQPWLQARQNDICFEATTTTMRSKDKWDDFDGNDIMMGDQPQDDYDNEYDDDNGEDIFDKATKNDEKEEKIEDTTDDDEKKEPNELDDEYIPVKDQQENTSVEPEQSIEPSNVENDFEDASGHGALPIIMESKQQIVEDDDDDGSGSGDDSLIPIIIQSSEHSDESTSEHSSTEEPQAPQIDEENGGEVTEQKEESTDVPVIVKGSKYNLSMGIFEDITEPPPLLTVDTQKGKDNVDKPSVEPVPDIPGKGGEKDNMQAASSEDNTGTYILLAVIGILLVSLIIFVAIKNRQEKRQNRRRYDVEKNGATELQDMDKSLLGKPIEKNGNGKHAEQTPLINDYKDKKDNRQGEFIPLKAPEITVDEPVQELPHKEKEKSQQSLYDMPNGNGNVHEPIEPVHTSPSNGGVPKLPDSDDEVFHPASDTLIDPESLNVSPEPPKRYSPVYSPVSPRSARYSPVYSPETGRVKIKLTETPKPKTPVVVTRSRSRAGDYVNTPNNY